MNSAMNENTGQPAPKNPYPPKAQDAYQGSPEEHPAFEAERLAAEIEGIDSEIEHLENRRAESVKRLSEHIEEAQDRIRYTEAAAHAEPGSRPRDYRNEPQKQEAPF